VSTLFAVASRPAGTAPLWALQGLLCVANAAGRRYGPHVKQTLQLCQELLVSWLLRACVGAVGVMLLRV